MHHAHVERQKGAFKPCNCPAMQIRKAMTRVEQRDLLTSIVEMDEVYIGGKPRRVIDSMMTNSCTFRLNRKKSISTQRVIDLLGNAMPLLPTQG